MEMLLRLVHTDFRAKPCIMEPVPDGTMMLEAVNRLDFNMYDCCDKFSNCLCLLSFYLFLFIFL